MSVRDGIGWVGPFTAVGLLLLGGVLGAGAVSFVDDDGPAEVSAAHAPDPPEPSSVSSTSTVTLQDTPPVLPGDEGTSSTTSSSAPAPPPEAVSRTTDGWMAVARSLAPLELPSDCTLPLENPESLPGADRSYRGGVHEGIDFICGERGRDAVAALDGRVVIANGSYVDPSPEEREEILATAKALGDTPPWTLAMLFGRFVVIDHGVLDGAGHVVSIYAHLDEIDPDIRPGLRVTAGQRLGEIGNLGTETAATGGTRPQSIHLHWEIHVDGEYLAAGASPAATSEIYATLFGR